MPKFLDYQASPVYAQNKILRYSPVLSTQPSEQSPGQWRPMWGRNSLAGWGISSETAAFAKEISVSIWAITEEVKQETNEQTGLWGKP